MEEVEICTGKYPISVCTDATLEFDCNCKCRPETILLRTKKPYLINPSNIECIVGEWNKDKGEYGVRVYFVSGNNNWFGGAVAKDLLERFVTGDRQERDKVTKKFEERVQAGPPNV